MDDPDEPGFTEPSHVLVAGTDPRRLYAVIAVLLVVIVVLTIRPWGDDGGRPTQGEAVAPSPGRATAAPRDPDASVVAEPTPGTLAAGLDETCGSPSGWRAATLQDWVGRSTPIRSWIAIEPVTASGPVDPGIPFAPVSTGVVTAIGYCAPLDDAERPPAAAVASLWSVQGGRALPMTLLPLEPSTPDALGGLWARSPEVPGEAPNAGTNRGVFPPGRYVVELASPGGEYRRWLGVEIADLTLLLRVHGALTDGFAVPVVGPVGIPRPARAVRGLARAVRGLARALSGRRLNRAAAQARCRRRRARG